MTLMIELSRILRSAQPTDDPPTSVVGAMLAGPIKRLDHAIPSIEREFSRARRYEDPLALVLITARDAFTPRPGATGGSRLRSKGLGRFTSRNPFTLSAFEERRTQVIGRLLSGMIREYDIITAANDGRYCLLFLPVTCRAEAILAGLRLGDEILNLAGLPLRMGFAEFPSEGLAIEELFEWARKDWLCKPLLTGEGAVEGGEQIEVSNA